MSFYWVWTMQRSFLPETLNQDRSLQQYAGRYTRSNVIHPIDLTEPQGIIKNLL